MTNAIARKLEALKERGGIKSIDVANLLGTTPETVSRWNTGKTSPHSGTQRALSDLEFMIDQLTELYEPDDARIWIFSRQRLLNGKRPADLIQEGDIDGVLQLIDQLKDGNYF